MVWCRRTGRAGDLLARLVCLLRCGQSMILLNQKLPPPPLLPPSCQKPAKLPHTCHSFHCLAFNRDCSRVCRVQAGLQASPVPGNLLCQSLLRNPIAHPASWNSSTAQQPNVLARHRQLLLSPLLPDPDLASQAPPRLVPSACARLGTSARSHGGLSLETDIPPPSLKPNRLCVTASDTISHR